MDAAYRRHRPPAGSRRRRALRLRRMATKNTKSHKKYLRAPLAAGQPVEDVNAALDGGVLRRVAQAEVGVMTAEHLAGDDEQVVADRLFHECRSRPPGGLGKHIKGAAGFDHLEPLPQPFVQPIAFAVVI